MAEQKVALVTGASRGIGAACAIALGEAGFQVAVHFRGEEAKARAVADRIPGDRARVFQADLSTEDGPAQLVKAVKEAFGRLDLLVNNAGVAIDHLLAMAKPEDINRLLDTNLKATILTSKHASKVMIRQRQGVIINLSSVVGHTGNGGQSVYAATKGALTAFTKSVALELASAGIRCNSVAPGFIDTDMTGHLKEATREAILAKVPLGRLGRPEDIAAAVVFLASDQAAYITGTTLHVNGGMYTT